MNNNKGGEKKIRWWHKFFGNAGYCKNCKKDTWHKETNKVKSVSYPHLGTGISTGNLALGLIPDEEYESICKVCGKTI